MRRVLILTAFLLASACASRAPAPEAPEPHGLVIAQTHCASCHAVALNDTSAAPEAPPLRTLWRNYRVDTLEEALAEGISVGHPAMPHFQFAPDEIEALIAYLQSIQSEPVQ